jgi:hypothetical protein
VLFATPYPYKQEECEDWGRGTHFIESVKINSRSIAKEGSYYCME